jgi:hypothetical protein
VPYGQHRPMPTSPAQLTVCQNLKPGASQMTWTVGKVSVSKENFSYRTSL